MLASTHGDQAYSPLKRINYYRPYVLVNDALLRCSLFIACVANSVVKRHATTTVRLAAKDGEMLRSTRGTPFLPQLYTQKNEVHSMDCPFIIKC